MVLEMRLPYLDSLGSMSYPTKDKVPVFLNGDLLNPIGDCQVLDGDDELTGLMWLNTDVSEDLFVYYLQDASVTDSFRFAGLHFREKTVRKTRWRQSGVIQMPRLVAGKEKRTKRLKDVVIWGL